jgi:hypothetical protein
MVLAINYDSSLSPSVAAGEIALKVIRSAERVGPHSTVGKNLQTSISLDEPMLVLYLAFEFGLIFIQIVAPIRHLSLG